MIHKKFGSYVTVNIDNPRLKVDPLMLYREIISVYCEHYTEHINTPCGQNVDYY